MDFGRDPFQLFGEVPRAFLKLPRSKPVPFIPDSPSLLTTGGKPLWIFGVTIKVIVANEELGLNDFGLESYILQEA